MRSFVGWSGLQRRTKRIILAAVSVAVVGTGVGLGVGIVAYQDANRVNSDSDPSFVYTDISKPPLAPPATTDPTNPTDPTSGTAEQDTADVATAVSALATMTTTTFSTAAFFNLSQSGVPWSATVAASLGLTAPQLPDGVSANLTKQASSLVLSFTVAKNDARSVTNVTVHTFLGDSEASLDNVARVLAATTVSSLGRAAFTRTKLDQTDFSAAAVAVLGLTYGALDPSVTVRVAKPSGSATLSFTISKNQASRTVMVEIGIFTADDTALVATVATALTTVTVSSLRSSDFFRLAVDQTTFDETSARTFGVTLPTLPDDVIVKVTKIAQSTSLTFVVSKGVALRVVSVPLTSFTGDNEDYFAETTALLERLVTSTLTQDAFTLFNQPKATFVPVTAAALGLAFPDELLGADISVTKPAGVADLEFLINKNGATRTITVTVANFANNDQQVLDALASSLEELTITSLDMDAFKRVALQEVVLEASVATQLGIPLPIIPDGITVTVTKANGTAELMFAVSKGTLHATASSTVTTFAGGDKLAVDAAFGALSGLTTTTLTRAAFTAMERTGAAWDAATAAALGLSFRDFAGVTITLTKARSGTALSFAISKGNSQRTATVTVDTFVGDDQTNLNTLAASLGAINTTSLTRNSLLAISLPQANLTNALAQTLGIVIPTIPAGTSVRISKAPQQATITFTVVKGQLTASASASITVFTGDTRVSLAAAVASLNALNTSSLTEAAFKNAQYAAVTFDLQQATTMGLALPTLPSGVVVTVTKSASSARLTFALSLAGLTDTASATITKFTGDDQPAVTSTAAILGGLTSTTLTAAVFTPKVFAQATFDIAAATALGIMLPSALPTGVVITVAKSAGSNVLTFALSRGAARQTVTVAVIRFASATLPPPDPNDHSISPAMQRAINYLSGYVDTGLTEELPPRVFNYVRNNFLVTVGAAAVDAWAQQKSNKVTVDNATIMKGFRDLMTSMDLDIGNPSIYAMWRLKPAMEAIVNILLADPTIDSLGLKIVFSGNETDKAIYAEAVIPTLPTNDSLVNSARLIVTETLPQQYFPYDAKSAADLPIGAVLAQFTRAHPL